MKKKLIVLTLCALFATASIIGSSNVVNTSCGISYILGDKAGGY